jgi:hypothetical protein
VGVMPAAMSSSAVAGTHVVTIEIPLSVTRTPLPRWFSSLPSCSLLLPESLEPLGGVPDRKCRVRLELTPYGGSYPGCGYDCSMGGVWHPMIAEVLHMKRWGAAEEDSRMEGHSRKGEGGHSRREDTSDTTI